MTDRYHSLTVVLERDTREEDAQGLIAAISMLKGVLTVGGNVASPESYMAQERVRIDLGKQILDIVYPKTKY